MSVNNKNIIGFTLIELSIVMVIIGLLLAGVLVGKDLIRAAEIRAQISQIEKVETSIVTFKEKYLCLPGDCLRAPEFFSDAVSGNGDGIIAELNDFWGGAQAEAWDVWHHLSSANLISGSYDNNTVSQKRIGIDSPAPSLKGRGEDLGGGGFFNTAGGLLVLGPVNNFVIEQFGTRNILYIGGTANINGNVFAIYSAADSYAMDSKMDDGKPFSGKFRSISGLPMDSVALAAYYPVSAMGDMGETACIDDISQSPEFIYNLDQDLQSPLPYSSWCSPVILMNF